MPYFLPTIQIYIKEKQNLSELSIESHLNAFFVFDFNPAKGRFIIPSWAT